LLVVEKQLLPGSENKLVPAVNALENPVYVVHPASLPHCNSRGEWLRPNGTPALVRNEKSPEFSKGALAAMRCGKPSASYTKPKRSTQALWREGRLNDGSRCAKHAGTERVGGRNSRRVSYCAYKSTLSNCSANTAYGLVLLFTSLFTIPLARQRFLHATLFAGLQVKGVTLHFLDDVLLLYLTLEPAQCIFKRFAFLHANLCQSNYTPKLTQTGSL